MASVLTLSINVLFASNDGAVMNSEMNSFHISLAPVTPAEATFEEIQEESAATINIELLAPAIPTVADFTDSI